MVNREKMIFETYTFLYNSQQFEATRSFTKSIFGGKIT